MKHFIRELAILLGLLWVILNFTFYVNETEYIVVMQMGKPVAQYKVSGGPHFKWPWPYQSTVSVDKRTQIYHSDPREIITKDKKTLRVAIFAFFRVVDPITYVENTQSLDIAQTRMDEIAYSEMHNQLGNHDFEEIVVTSRSEIMDTVTVQTNELIQQYGLETPLVRMNQVDLPPENQKSVYARMSEERKRQAKQYRGEGAQDSTRITAETDKKVTMIISEAKNQAQQIRGHADATATAIYNGAYAQDPEFFKLLTSLDVAKNIYGDPSGTKVNLVLTGKEMPLKELLLGK